MKNFYLIRHGSTSLNSSDESVDRIRGWSNPELSKDGHEEVKKTANKLKNSGIVAIVSSDLKRAIQTAEAIRETTGGSIEGNEKLRPWNVGDFTGKESKKVFPVLQKYVENENKKCPNGESFNDFKRRFFGGLDDILKKYEGKNLAIVTHHRGERLIKAWLAKGQPKDKDIDLDIFFQHGEPPANSEIIHLKEDRLKKNPKGRILEKKKQI